MKNLRQIKKVIGEVAKKYKAKFKAHFLADGNLEIIFMTPSADDEAFERSGVLKYDENQLRNEINCILFEKYYNRAMNTIYLLQGDEQFVLNFKQLDNIEKLINKYIKINEDK